MRKIALLLACCMLVLCCAVSCGEGAVGEYVPGVRTESGYSSDWLGLTFVPSENMCLSTAEEVEELLGEGTTVYEMLATDIKTNDSVILMTEEVGDDISIEDYIAALKTQMNSQSGISAEFGNTKTVRVGGGKYTRIGYTITYDGYSVGQAMYFMKRGDQMVTICVTAADESSENVIMSCFKAK